ncbi:hypothetical protein D9M72_606710 [compost metagenome]
MSRPSEVVTAAGAPADTMALERFLAPWTPWTKLPDVQAYATTAGLMAITLRTASWISP